MLPCFIRSILIIPPKKPSFTLGRKMDLVWYFSLENYGHVFGVHPISGDIARSVISRKAPQMQVMLLENSKNDEEC